MPDQDPRDKMTAALLGLLTPEEHDVWMLHFDDPREPQFSEMGGDFRAIEIRDALLTIAQQRRDLACVTAELDAARQELATTSEKTTIEHELETTRATLHRAYDELADRMTVRDEFAKAALIALIAAPESEASFDDVVGLSWIYADAMMKAREARHD